MLISELIAQLQAVQAERGDLPVSQEYGEMGYREVQGIDVMSAQFTSSESDSLAFVTFCPEEGEATHIQLSLI